MKIDGFEQKDSQGFENSYNSYEQYPLEKFIIFTIYHNYTLALIHINSWPSNRRWESLVLSDSQIISTYMAFWLWIIAVYVTFSIIVILISH